MSRLSFVHRAAQSVLKPFGLTVVPAAGIKTSDLMRAVDAILDAAMDDPATKNWSVNWGDLQCVNIIYCADCYGGWWIDVMIEEASDWRLADYVGAKLTKQGWDTRKLNIRTEW